MTHEIFISEMDTNLIVDETLCENVAIVINDSEHSVSAYLNPSQLDDLISVLQYVKSKKTIK